MVIALMCTVSIFRAISDHVLPYNCWIPYDINSNIPFAITFIYEVLASLIATSMQLAFDAFVIGCIIHIIAQFEILQYRLKAFKIVKDDNDDGIKSVYMNKNCLNETDRFLTDCVKYYVKIIKLVSLTLHGYNVFIHFS